MDNLAGTLHAALSACTSVDSLTAEQATFFKHAIDVPAGQWDLLAMQRAHYLIAGPLRIDLEAQGWDVDLIPQPPQTAPEKTYTPPASNAVVPPDRIGVIQHTTEAVLVTAAPKHPIHATLRDLPGSSWDGVRRGWAVPIERETALLLRAALTGHKIAIDPAAAATLKNAANTESHTLNCIRKGDKIHIKFAHTTAREDDVKRLTKAKWDGHSTGAWVTDAGQADNVIMFAQKHALTYDEGVEAAAKAKNAPFDYDLTVDGLRGVPVTELNFVASAPVPRGKKAKTLAQRLGDYGISSVYDCLSVIPRRYMDRSSQTPIRDLTVGEEVGFLARVTSVGAYDRTKRLIRITVSDGTAEVQVSFFNAPWAAYRFRTKDEVVVYGRLDAWSGGGRRRLQMTNPVMDPVGNDTAMIVPVYPQSEKSKVTTWDIHGPAMESVRRMGDLQDPLPDDIRSSLDLLTRETAYKQVHAPTSLVEAERARNRLAFDELFRMQLALGMQKAAAAAAPGIQHNPSGVLVKALLDQYRFTPTGAQQRAFAEIRDDLTRPQPMHRLLQGDVGSGKTLISLVTLLSGVEGGYQGALMAPTEILASQLFAELADECSTLSHPDGHPVIVEFLGGKTRVKEKRRILAGLTSGEVDIVVGTHALLSPDVEFANLGVVVIDEQHRFGVEQRATLRAKGKNGSPDTLVMTATPIPRTQAISVFGDLDITVLDELPPGRTPIATKWIPGEVELGVITGEPWDLVRREVEAGHQAYVVASLVEDNENIAAASAEDALTSLEAGALTGLRLGLVHGKQPRDEREATMTAFKNHELDVLIATTVIEVGVNVPNATVMVVLDATRFGIAQLHQIRGRVGRGQYASYCVLTGKAGSEDAVLRMQALCDSTDGFYLAEVDLSLRGEGSLFGARQSGQSDLRVASLKNDKELLESCRELATRVLSSDPKLLRRPGLRNEVLAALGEEAQEWLNRS